MRGIKGNAPKESCYCDGRFSPSLNMEVFLESWDHYIVSVAVYLTSFLPFATDIFDEHYFLKCVVDMHFVLMIIDK